MSRAVLTLAFMASSLALLFPACGGNVVVDDAVSSGGGSTTSSSSSSGSGATCAQHTDCPTDWLCLFATGTCAPSCVAESCSPCSAGTFCDGCATSFCPECQDCRAACVPTPAGRCDDDDPCPAGKVCEHLSGYCLDACTTDNECGGFAFCDQCAASSCCNCEDCKAGCVGGE